MVSVRKRRIHGRDYYYLVHTFRVDGRVRTAERYLGSEVPEDLGRESELLLAQEWALRWYPRFEQLRHDARHEERALPPEIREKNLEEFSIRFTFNTNRIEGSQLTFHDTALLLRDKLTPPSRPLSDVSEARSHQSTFLHAIRSRDVRVTLPRILLWHRTIFGETKPSVAGRLRTYRVAISNSRFTPPPPESVAPLLREFLTWRARALPITHPVRFAAESHLRFESIHPFGDGNGRVGRLLLNFDLWILGYPLFDLAEERRRHYYEALESSQVGREDRPFFRWFFPEYLRDAHPRPVSLTARHKDSLPAVGRYRA